MSVVPAPPFFNAVRSDLEAEFVPYPVWGGLRVAADSTGVRADSVLFTVDYEFAPVVPPVNPGPPWDVEVL